MRAKRFVRVVVVCCCALVLAAGIVAIAAWQPALDPITPPSASAFPAELVKRGADLAALGDCDVCHTAQSGSQFAGGRAIPTPFGTIFSSNITPDAETGIGNWSEPAFQRAMRYGVRRDGAYLYPAFPYDHFTLVSDDDDKALYAFLMSRTPVRAAPPANLLPFPFNVRLVLYGWDFLFLRPGPYQTDAAHDATWNRGAYLTLGLGHCGACHTPRNFLGAEKRNQELAGGTAEGWTAYALDEASPAPVHWDGASLTQYLSHGFADLHGVARGPMADVAGDLRSVPQDDVRAIADYVASQMGPAPPESSEMSQQAKIQSQRGKPTAAATADSQAEVQASGDTKDQGALIYASACAGCHQGPRAMPFGGIDLALSSGIGGPSADNLVNVVLYGLPASEAQRTPIMPGFAASMNDGQIAALARYLRGHFTDKGPWTGIDQSINAARERAATVRHAPEPKPSPPSTSQRTSSHEAQR